MEQVIPGGDDTSVPSVGFLPQKLDFYKRDKLIARVKEKWDAKDIRTLLAQYQPLFFKIKSKVYTPQLQRIVDIDEDIKSCFLKLVHEFDFKRGVYFSLYIKRKLWHEVYSLYFAKINFICDSFCFPKIEDSIETTPGNTDDLNSWDDLCSIEVQEMVKYVEVMQGELAQDVFVLRCFFGFTQCYIAEIVGFSQPTVFWILHGAKKAVRAYIDGKNIDLFDSATSNKEGE